MNIITFSSKSAAILFSFSLLFACSNGTGPRDYDEGQPTQRVDEKLTFSSPSYMKMAESFRIVGDYSNALRLYQRTAAENPSHAPSRLALGQIYQRLGANDGAITYYRQTLDLEPGNIDAQLGLGQMMVRSNNPGEAIKYLEAVAEKSPDNYRIYNSIGLAYDLEGLHEQAQLAYGTGLNKKPDHISLLNNLALSFAIDGDYAPSIQLLSRAVNIDYSQTTAQLNLIMVYALSGEEDAARNMANAFMTPDEIDTNLAHYKWLATLSSKRRAQAIFLNLKSFPDEEAQIPTIANKEPTKTQPFVSMDPKKQMLADILGGEERAEQSGLQMDEVPASDNQAVKISPQEIQEALAKAAIADETIAQDEMPLDDENYHLQLGSHSSLNDLIKDWGRLQGLAPDMLNETEIDVDKVVTAENTDLYRLFIGDYNNIYAAEEYCKTLLEKNIYCVVSKVIISE